MIGKYEFLLRSMLALGASHLNVTTSSPAEMESRALTHRVQAVNLLNKALSRPATSKAEADARFATFMNLTFQSACMKEGLIDFFTMLRGCILQGDLGELSAFASFFQDNHLKTMNIRFSQTQLEEMESEDLDGGVESLAALEPLCQTGVEKRYHQLLTELVLNAYTSPKAGESNPTSYIVLVSNHSRSACITSALKIPELTLLQHINPLWMHTTWLVWSPMPNSRAS
jgi:hypothetical protein